MYRRGITPILFYSGSDINSLNDSMWRDIQIFGNPLHFGTPAPGKHVKKALDIFAVTQLYGEALEKLYSGQVPEGWKFTGSMNKVYIEMLKNPDPGDQYYTYGQRLHEKDQIGRVRDALKACIETGIQSNRIVGIIWDKYEDLDHEDPPCFNWFQLKLMENNLVSLRTLFRSHCFVNGDWANYGAIIKVFCEECIWPAGGSLSEYINISTSAQIGAGDVNTVIDRVGDWTRLNSFFNYYGEPWERL